MTIDFSSPIQKTGSILYYFIAFILLFGPAFSIPAWADYPYMIDIAGGEEIPDEDFSDQLWFHRLGEPRAWSVEELEYAVSEIYQLLRGEDTGTAGEFDFFSVDPEVPRIVGISWTCGKERAQTVYGRGIGWAEALADGAARARQRGADRAEVEYVKLDAVQDTIYFPGWELDEHQIPDPGFRGVAFSTDFPYAFLPEQIKFNRLYTPERKLYGVGLAGILVRKVDFRALGLFKNMIEIDEKKQIFSFDTQSVFFAGDDLELVYRGHYSRDEIDRSDLMEAVERGVEFMSRQIERDGSISAAGDAWTIHTEHGEHSLFSQVATLWAFLRYVNLTGDESVLAAARRQADYLADYMESVPDSDVARPLVEFTMADLDANALGVMAWLELAELTGEQEYLFQALRMAHFLRLQLQPSGAFMRRRYLPQNNIEPRISVRSSAMAIAAFTQLYEQTEERWFVQTAETAMDYLLQDHLETAEMRELSAFPWFVSAADSVYTYTRDPDLVRQAERLVLSLDVLQRKEELPVADLLGSYADRATTTRVADLTAPLVDAVRLLMDAGEEETAETALEILHFNLIFQLQSQLEMASTMYIRNPGEKLGAFRDDIREMVMSLEGQSLQLLSLVSVLELMEDKQISRLPLGERRQEALTDRKKLFFQFGRGLPFELMRRRDQ